MTSLVVLKYAEPEDAEADAARDAAGAVADIAAAIRRIELVLDSRDDPQYARLLAEAAVRITEGATAAEEATRAIRDLEARRLLADAIAAAAYERCRGDMAASRPLGVAGP